ATSAAGAAAAATRTATQTAGVKCGLIGVPRSARPSLFSGRRPAQGDLWCIQTALRALERVEGVPELAVARLASERLGLVGPGEGGPCQHVSGSQSSEHFSPSLRWPCQPRRPFQAQT